jgi:hypothetical protein
MRSIGKKNIKLVQNITRDNMKQGRFNVEDIKEQLPIELWDTWESAEAEISRVIMDTIYERALKGGRGELLQ